MDFGTGEGVDLGGGGVDFGGKGGGAPGDRLGVGREGGTCGTVAHPALGWIDGGDGVQPGGFGGGGGRMEGAGRGGGIDAPNSLVRSAATRSSVTARAS